MQQKRASIHVTSHLRLAAVTCSYMRARNGFRQPLSNTQVSSTLICSLSICMTSPKGCRCAWFLQKFYRPLTLTSPHSARSSIDFNRQPCDVIKIRTVSCPMVDVGQFVNACANHLPEELNAGRFRLRYCESVFIYAQTLGSWITGGR